MRAQVLYGIGNLKYAEIDVPKPKKGEALVKVTHCGICGSDVPRIYKTGAHNMPLVPGHEFAGEVVECEDVPELIGKRVGVFPLIPCGQCSQCQKKHYEMCENYNYLGSRCDGGFAEFVCVPVWNLVTLPDAVGNAEAAMLEPMCVAVHAARQAGLKLFVIPAGQTPENQADVHSVQAGAKSDDIPDDQPDIVVCGLGTIGLLLAMFLKDAGYSKVLFVCNKDVQRKKLFEMGYSEDCFCDVRFGDPVNFVMEKTGGKGADYYFECIGRPENYAQAVKCAAPLGTVLLVGNPASDMELPRDVYWKILRNQLTLKGTWNSSYLGVGENDIIDDWKYVLGRLSAWREDANTSYFSPENLITHRISLEELGNGLDIMHRKSEEYVKIMVVL